MLDTKIQNAINYHTNRIAKILKLNSSDKDDVRQELTLTALEAIKTHTDDMDANRLTYVKAALSRGAALVMRKLKSQPPTAHVEFAAGVDEAQDEYRRGLDANASYTPLTVSTGTSLEQLTVDDHADAPDMALDVQAVLETLSPRQKTICQLLMAGYTQEEIAAKVNLKKSRISEIIQELKPYFHFFLKNGNF